MGLNLGKRSSHHGLTLTTTNKEYTTMQDYVDDLLDDVIDEFDDDVTEDYSDI